MPSLVPSQLQALLINSQPLRERLLSTYRDRAGNYRDLMVVKKGACLDINPFLEPHDLVTTSSLSRSGDLADWQHFADADGCLPKKIIVERVSSLCFDLSQLPAKTSLEFVEASDITLFSSSDKALDLDCIFIRNCESVFASDLNLRGRASFHFDGCKAIHVQNCRFTLVETTAMVFRFSSSILIDQNYFSRCSMACVFIGEGVKDYSITATEFNHCQGKSNWHAPIVVSGRNDIGFDTKLEGLFESDGYWAKAQMLFDMLNSPRNGWIFDNKVVHSQSSGIYLDGAVDLVVERNIISNASKEGICLDYGCMNAYVVGNSILANGDRYGKSDDDLQKDFVLGFGRDDRGSAKAKLPGISIDNSAFCQIIANYIGSNFGSGIKMVRTGFANLIAFNQIISNNMGQNDTFHFFGIELGAAKADVDAPDLDFLGSSLNVIAQNILSGSHYAGILLVDGSEFNFVCDNMIVGAKVFSIESLKLMSSNEYLNNYGNSPSRNCSLSVLGPVYQGAGMPSYD